MHRENKTRGFDKEREKKAIRDIAKAIVKSACAHNPRPGDELEMIAVGLMPAVFDQCIHEAVKDKLNRLGFEEEGKAMEEEDMEKPHLKAEIPSLLQSSREAKINGVDIELTLEALRDVAKACMKLIRANQLGLAGIIEQNLRNAVSVEVIQRCMNRAIEEAMVVERLMDEYSDNEISQSLRKGMDKDKRR